jgi:hypothetical protein
VLKHQNKIRLNRANCSEVVLMSCSLALEKRI